MNKKRVLDQQSTETEDNSWENRQAKNILSDTLNKIASLEQKKVPESMDKGESIPPKESTTAKELEERYPTFFDDESGNENDKKQGYAELKEYLEGELKALPSTKQTSAMESPSIDRETKKQKSSDQSEAKEKASSSDQSEAGKKESPIDFVVGKMETEMPSYTDPED